MRVVVIGLGSMGKRRIRLIQKKYGAFDIIGVDTNEERRKTCEEEWRITTYNNLTEAIATTKIDCAFICTSPLSHCNIITQCLNSGLHVFSELNLVADGYEENIVLAKQKNVVLFLSSTFLYRDEIKQIKSLTKQTNCQLNYTYHIGQYLPDWHPWENYEDFFVGNKRSNGCREIFAIELPWLSDVFGDIIKVDVIKSKMSNLNIDYEDNYLVLIQHDSGYKGTLAVDIVSRKAVRNLEVFGEQLYLHWDGSPNGLYVYDYAEKRDVKVQLYKELDQLENYSSFVVENAYSNEIDSFFNAIIEGKVPIYSFENDKNILRIIDRLEA
ncbi:putative dehydrogenase [Desulfitobacterium dichloroeliminans LMG P-21439]|uniref:Putative dehydrogenase n=1 Tax=Desulfitobacterium dichloroeliminans (strain LMG P-21439 / DCA1) TaxID=871963 RepID=L0FD87_DESDL|nr:Gfo/Idh/MocA family oxidoreductase [Desulfitobacterium dichloroeliminans]AGA70601.1 putative dehydrogenase [Desulfitobacterium dichloroeliminans LMG P-21439]